MGKLLIAKQANDFASIEFGLPASLTTLNEISKSQRFGFAGDLTEIVRLTYASPQTFEYVALVGLDVYSDVTITLKNGASTTHTETILGSTNQSKQHSRKTYNLLFSFTEVLADQVEITFAGTAPKSIATILAGNKAWQASANSHNFSMPDSNEQEVDNMRSWSFSLGLLELSNFKDLQHAKYLIGDSHALVMKDSESTEPDDWMIAELTLLSNKYISNTAKQTTLNSKEATKWK